MQRFIFSDDRPGTDPWTDDDFGYRLFATHLAEVLIGLEAPRGYVLGLHGAWGSGKTTAMNFVRHFVEVANGTEDVPLELVDFQPWMVSGQQDLMASFFRVLADRLRPPSDYVKRAITLAGTAAKTAVDPLVKAAVTLAVAAHPTDTVAINAGGELAKRAMNQTVDAWLAEPTLQAAHDDLARKLRESGRRFLVMIDDIDRLEPGEIRSIMQMVKSVGQLPNVIYFLAYDRRVVWRALAEREARKEGEPTFTEKIVQHEVELPHATRRALLRKLDRETQFILSTIKASHRWNEIVQSGIYRWIRYPRDVIRFSNGLRFAWPPLMNEVDPADVMAMEGLRLFEPEIFDWIRDNRHFIADRDGLVLEAEQKAKGAQFREGVPTSKRDTVVDLLCVLFPHRASVLRERQSFGFSETWVDAVNRKGVAVPRGFDAYFALFPSPYELPRSILDAVAAAPDDQAVQDEAIAAALAATDESGKSLIGDYLDDLQFRLIGRDAIRPGKAMLRSLVRNADVIARQERTGMMVVPPYPQYQMIIRRMLEGWGPGPASEIVIEAADEIQSAAILSGLFVWRARESGRLPDEGTKVGAVISEAALDHLGARALERIRAEASAGSLAEAPFYWEILQTWGALETPEAARTWLMDQAEQSPQSLAKIATGLLATSQGDTGLVYSFQGIHSDHEFYDLDCLLAASHSFADRVDLDPVDAMKISVLRDGLRARAARAARGDDHGDDADVG